MISLYHTGRTPAAQGGGGTGDDGDRDSSGTGSYQ